MRVLTIKNPWATLILQGIKTLEVRTWPTSYRGPLGIHIGSGEDRRREPHVLLANQVADLDRFPKSALCGQVELIDVRPMRPEDAEAACVPFRESLVWVLESPLVYASAISMHGKLGLWHYSESQSLTASAIPGVHAFNCR